MQFRHFFMVLVLAALVFSVPRNVEAQQRVLYYPYVIARGNDRQIIRSMPIEKRPQRPMHVYGNTVRRLSSNGGRQQVLPMISRAPIQRSVARPRLGIWR